MTTALTVQQVAPSTLEETFWNDETKPFCPCCGEVLHLTGDMNILRYTNCIPYWCSTTHQYWTLEDYIKSKFITNAYYCPSCKRVSQWDDLNPCQPGSCKYQEQEMHISTDDLTSVF